MRAAMRAEAPRLRETRRTVRRGFDEVLEALRTEPYDAARVAAIVEAQQAWVQDQMALSRRVMLDRLAAMSPAERAAFADRLQEVLRRGPPRDRDGGGDRGPELR